jgi:hypothetical protein
VPEYDLSPIPPPIDEPPMVLGDVPCSGCGYNLRGLPTAGICPECGRAVEFTLRGNLLRFASSEYLRQIDLGLVVILTAIVAYFVVVLAGLGIAFFGARYKKDFTLVAQGLSLVCSGMFIFGYWKYTTPDPGYTGIEKVASARTIARTTACINAACDGGSFILTLLGAATLQSIQPSGSAGTILLVVGYFGVVFLRIASWATQFFAIVFYTRWLAERVPDYDLITRTRTYLWLLPLLYTVGAIVFCIGPLIALILYATMLQSLRTRTKDILDWQLRGGQTLA